MALYDEHMDIWAISGYAGLTELTVLTRSIHAQAMLIQPYDDDPCYDTGYDRHMSNVDILMNTSYDPGNPEGLLSHGVYSMLMQAMASYALSVRGVQAYLCYIDEYGLIQAHAGYAMTMLYSFMTQGAYLALCT